MTKISEGYMDFKTLERFIFRIACEAGCELIREYLTHLDRELMAERDASEYRYVRKGATTIKTQMGEVTFERRYYRKREGGHVFLLDEAMGLERGCGLVSENLAELIARECCDKSFRKAAESIRSCTGQGISGPGTWNVFQQLASTIEKKEIRLQELDESGSTGHLGNKTTPVLFTEYDDVWISRQKQKRCRKAEVAEVNATDHAKKIGKRPMHMATAYSGWKLKKDGTYATVDKIACASYGKTDDFVEGFEILLRHYYDMDGVGQRIVNGDGEAWIKTAAESQDSLLQLDPYHRSKAIIRCVSNKDDRQLLFNAIGEKDVNKLLFQADTLYKAAKTEKEQKKLEDLVKYLRENKNNLLTWQERGIQLPVPPEGIVYRNLGVQESSNCSLITQRMKHRRGSWSKPGANHMAKVLCFRHTIGLDTILGNLPEPLPVKAWPEPLSAAKTPKHDGKGYSAAWLYAEMPFTHASSTHGREVIRNMVKQRSLSDLHG